MKVIMFMAISLDGYIARLDGDEDFLSHQNWQESVKLAREAGNIVVGRKTYEIVQAWSGGYNLSSIENIKRIVVSTDPDFKVSDDFIVVDSPEAALVELRNSNVVHLSGGGSLNTAFASRHLIDELIIDIEPVVIGEGHHLFANMDFDMKLKLLNTKSLDDGLLQLHYQVLK